MTILSDILRYCADHNIDIDIPKVATTFVYIMLDCQIFYIMLDCQITLPSKPGSFSLATAKDADGTDCRSGSTHLEFANFVSQYKLHFLP